MIEILAAWQTIKNLLDKTIVKLILAIVILGMILYSLFFVYNAIYEAGANSVKVQYAEAYKKKEAELNGKLAEAIKSKQESRDTASKIQEDLRDSKNENKKLRKEIYDIKDNFNCSSLGDDFNLRWKETIGEEPTY